MLKDSLKNIDGVGLGLRFDHFEDILKKKTIVPWFEVIVEDFLSPGPHHQKLMKLRELYPIVLHSIGLNLGGVDSFDEKYLSKLKDLYEALDPAWISDHLCWSSLNGHFHHDLLPILKTKEALDNVCERINYLQNYFERQLIIENITSYIEYQQEDFSEIQFIEEIVSKTGCGLLLDISNVIINHKNRDLDYWAYIDDFPLDSVKQVHLSGGDFDGNIIIDSHGQEVNFADIEVLKEIYKRGYHIPAMIERDTNIPPFFDLEKERIRIERELDGLS